MKTAKLFATLIAGMALALPAHAAFFQLAENSGSGLGESFAAGATARGDASGLWYNPASMAWMGERPQFSLATHYISPDVRYNNTKAASTPLVGGGNTGGGNGGNTGTVNIVPNFYYAQAINNQWAFGLGINAPFGSATKYEDGWVGRYHALESSITTINVNPALSFRLNESLSFGIGANYQTIDAKLTSAIDYATLCTLAPLSTSISVASGLAISSACGARGGYSNANTTMDGYSEVKGTASAWGYNLGALWQAQSSKTMVGLAYRSEMKHSLTGTSTIIAPNSTAKALTDANGIKSTNISATIKLPATLSLSAEQPYMENKLAVFADITRTFWSSLPELRVVFDTGYNAVTTLKLNDVNRYSIGARYVLNESTKLRAGFAYDESPTPNALYRSVRVPDGDRNWYTLGAGYDINKSMTLDLGLAYIIVADGNITKSAGTSSSAEDFTRGTLIGYYSSTTTILSAQFGMKF